MSVQTLQALTTLDLVAMVRINGGKLLAEALL